MDRPSWFFCATIFFAGYLGGIPHLSASAKVPKDIKVGVILDKGGRDDKSFNAAAYQGATQAQKKLGFQLKVVESSDDSQMEPFLRTFAGRGFDLVIGIGFAQQAPLSRVAPQFPKTHFVAIDSTIDSPNTRSVVFKEHEGAYLVGVIAALTTKTKIIGFVGGMDVPMIRRFELGYRSGITSINPGIKVLVNFVGVSPDSFRNPGKGKELALSQYHRNADIIFAAAGSSGLGVFDAAEETKKLAIGVDSNQNWVKPGRVLTSMIKRVDRAVAEAIELEVAGKFSAGKFDLGLAEGGVDYSIDSYNRSLLTPEVEKKVNEIKAKIARKEIVVPDFYEKKR